jgi:hypothetical protein
MNSPPYTVPGKWKPINQPAQMMWSHYPTSAFRAHTIAHRSSNNGKERAIEISRFTDTKMVVRSEPNLASVVFGPGGIA